MTNPAFGYDSDRSEVAIFSGVDRTYLTDTWIFDGVTWTDARPAVSPPPRTLSGSAYDPVHHELVVYGGLSASTTEVLADTWLWDGHTWTEATALGPGPRYGSRMVWDAQLGRVVLWGGSSLVQDYNDTWTWDGTAWLPLAAVHSPPTRILPAFGYDTARSRVVLYGGIENGSGLFDDTWTFDGSDWTQQNPAIVPPGRSEGMLAPDATTGGLVMFGGEGDRMFDETWTWDGTGWTQQSPLLSPSPRRDGVFVYDPAMHADVLFGGSDEHAQALGDTWTWTPATAQPVAPEAPWAAALVIPAVAAAGTRLMRVRARVRKRPS